jgi:hypothetical protein
LKERCDVTQQEKDKRALLYAEQYGILDWKVKGNRMIYYANYPEYLSEPRKTYKVTVRLDAMKEERQKLTKWNPKGNANMYK